MSLVITQVDAFTNAPFAGNPAAIVVLDRPVATTWMQHLARELNLSETAFLTPEPTGGFGLRWFTPSVEVDLCGHATLAAAHVLWESGRLDSASPARFFTRSGPLAATLGPEDWITMNFPADPVGRFPPPNEPWAEILGISEADVVHVASGRFDLLVEVTSAALVQSIRPDMGRLLQLPSRGLIVTSRAEPGSLPHADFVSRWFGPRVGVPEDPVTGSAHCVLGPYWAGKLGRDRLVGYQASERGGVVRVTVAGDRVFLAGQAVTIARGTLTDRADPPEELGGFGASPG